MPSSIPTIMSIGGSIVVPKDGIDTRYLEALRKLVLDETRRGQRFIIVVGGGYTARAYQQAAGSISKLDAEDLDWLGIHATRLNAHLLRSMFRHQALARVVKDPTRKVAWTEPVMIAAGWKPGWSTDYVAVRLARKYGAKRVINLTNIDMVYDKDPSLFEDAMPISRVAWKDFRKLVGNKWRPGANAPFDPVASRLAQRWGLEVVIANGKKLKNLKAILHGEKFKGTVIDGA